MVWGLIFLIVGAPIYPRANSIVTATKIEEPAEYIGKSMTIITREDIEKDGASTVFEILRSFPGIHFVQQGPFGGVTQIYIRGTKPGHTLVLIDGVKVNDPTSSDRSFDWATLPTVAVERIEVIRGIQSALYGSDAFGGVINIITKAGKRGMKLEGSLSAGSYYTFRENAGVSGGTDIFDYAVSLFNISSKGISKALAKEDVGSTCDRDGYTNKGFYTKLTIQPFNNLSMGLMGGVRDAKIDIDDGQFKDDPDASAFSTSTYGNLFLEHKTTDLWHHKFSLGLNKIERGHEDKRDEKDTTEWSDYYEGDYIKGEWQNKFTLHKHLSAVAGFEYAKESAESWCACSDSPDTSRLPRKSIFNHSLYIELEPKYRNLFFIFTGRTDSYKTYKIYKIYKTYQGSMAWLVNSTKFKGSYGTGFKTPTIHQLFSPEYGNPELKAEEIYGYDVSGEHRFEDGLIEIVYFNKRIRKLIELEEGKYMNRKRIWYSAGIELNLLLSITNDWRMEIQYTGVEKDRHEADYLPVPSHNYRWVISYKGLNLKFC